MEWVALGLDIRSSRAQNPQKPTTGFNAMIHDSVDMQIQLAQESGLSREAVRARALRAIFLFGIDLHDKDLIMSTDPIESELLPDTKEI